MKFYDAHIHKKNLETGGFIIGLEKKYYGMDTLSNAEVISACVTDKKYVAFYYVSKEEIDQKVKHNYLKFHARLEQYAPEQVISSIELNQPRAVIIDTLNEPYWHPCDYWKIAKKFSRIPIVFAHAGGYSINEFIKICNIQKNVWLDFSLTHSVLGKYGADDGLPYIHQAICFSLKHNFKERILFGSDYPFYEQDQITEYYANVLNMLNANFEKLLDKIR